MTAPKLTYKQKLMDPRWQKKRLQILERDGWTCRYCGDTEKTLHVHHVHYHPDAEGPWDYLDTSLVTLCCDCHEHETPDLTVYRNAFIASVVAAGAWKSGHFSLLVDAFSTKEPMSDEEMEVFAAAIMELTQSRMTHLAKRRGDPDAEKFITEDLWLRAKGTPIWSAGG